jgi:hypothetical protein
MLTAGSRGRHLQSFASHKCRELHHRLRKSKSVLVLNKINLYSVKIYMEAGGLAPPFLTSVLDVSEWSTSSPFYFISGKSPRYPLTEYLLIFNTVSVMTPFRYCPVFMAP